MTHRFRRGWIVAASSSLLSLGGCVDREALHHAIDVIKRGPSLDSIPVMLNDQTAFRYPSELYAKRVQGNVTLRVRIDTTGAVMPASTIVLESSGYPRFDSAALFGARGLKFSPARIDGRALSISLRVPVQFRLPLAARLSGDSVLHVRDAATADTTRASHRQP